MDYGREKILKGRRVERGEERKEKGRRKNKNILSNVTKGREKLETPKKKEKKEKNESKRKIVGEEKEKYKKENG